MRRACGAVVVVVACLFGAPMRGSAQGTSDPASAVDDDVARSLFSAGKLAFNAGDYEGALRFFDEAYERSHRPGFLYNIGQAADRLRMDARALEAFRAYLSAVPEAYNRAEVENRIRAMERTRDSAQDTAMPAESTPPPPEIVVPTPAQTAQRATPSESPLQGTASDQPNGGVTSKWWFWTGIGAVVVAGVITAIALSSGETLKDPAEPNSGVTAVALGDRR